MPIHACVSVYFAGFNVQCEKVCTSVDELVEQRGERKGMKVCRRRSRSEKKGGEGKRVWRVEWHGLQIDGRFMRNEVVHMKRRDRDCGVLRDA